MGTPFTDVYDRALTTITDYHLEIVAKSNEDAFYEFLQGLLIFSIPYFDECMQSLDYNITTASFDVTLTNKEVNILAEILVWNWFKGKVRDVSQFELKLMNREFKTNAESQNFKVKKDYENELREKYQQDITDYLLSKDNFSKIFNITLN